MSRNTNPSFTDRVLDVVRSIPKGSTMTYGEVAVLAGSPGASRAVGTIMKHNFLPDVPCHRVVRANGSLGEYNRGGTSAKQALLMQEGAI